jgi:transposase-like protein
MSLEKRQMIEYEIKTMREKTGILLAKLLSFAGVPDRTWREWQERREVATKNNGQVPRYHWLTPEERAAIIAYCTGRMEKGYRMLCWEMVDRNIVCVSASSVYNVIKVHNLAHKWSEQTEEAKKGFDQPKAVHEQWHIDFSYIKIGGAFYYFLSILDGYSRKILVWDLYQDMEGIRAEVLLTRARELYPAAKARVISDNGGQFVSKDFRELAERLEFEQTFISPAHPQSNGKLERFHRTFKTEHVRRSAYFGHEDAKKRMSAWLGYYNDVRLHSAIWYLTPQEVFEGKTEQRLAERKEKLHTAYINRRSYWQTESAKLHPTL